MPKGDLVESTDNSITESQFSSTMPYCEESLVAKLDPMGESQFLSAQPCHKGETTSAHESANMTTEDGISDSGTEDCSSAVSASKMLPMSSLILFLILTLNLILIMMKCSQVRRLDLKEPSEPVSPPKVRRSTRSTKGIPPTRYGSVTSHRVNVNTKLGKWLNSISKKIDVIHGHIFD